MDAITHDVIYCAPMDEIALVLSRHGGDVRAAIRSLLDERKQLRERLALAEICLANKLISSCEAVDCI